MASVLSSNVEAEIAAISKAADNNEDVVLAAPGAYLIRGGRSKIRSLQTGVGTSLAVFYPIGRATYEQLSGAPTAIPYTATWSLGLALFVAPNTRHVDVVESWGTLDRDGLEFRRQEMLVGAVTNVLFRKAHNGLDINSVNDPQVEFGLQLGPADFGDHWAEITWTITQRVFGPQREDD